MASFLMYKETAAYIERFSDETSLYLHIKVWYSNSVPLKGSNSKKQMNRKHKSPAYSKIMENVFLLVYIYHKHYGNL